MSKEKLGQEPAYPEFVKDSGGETLFISGMSKRFYAACAAMQAVLSNPETMKVFIDMQRTDEIGIKKEEVLISGCYAWADELLKQENE